MIDLFETAMSVAGRIDKLIFSSRIRKTVFTSLILVLITLTIFIHFLPSPQVPEMPCPPDGYVDLGLQPTLWWVGGAPITPILFEMGLDPNSHIAYEVLLGTDKDNLSPLEWQYGGNKLGYLNHNLTSPLQPGATYFWKIRAKNRLNKNADGPVWKFSTIPLPTIEYFVADHEIIESNMTVNLSWSVINASETIIGPDLGTVPQKGDLTIVPLENVSYTLMASNFAGDRTYELHITVLENSTYNSVKMSEGHQ